MPKAIIYTRVSTEEQVDNNSLEFQGRDLQQICEREGIDVLATFIEKGVSAKNKGNRPELMAALKLALETLKPGDYFMTYDVSRFTRNHKEGVDMLFRLRSKGILFRDKDRAYTAPRI